jgi:RNA polymerase sigma-70 factor (ECF subfamily)
LRVYEVMMPIVAPAVRGAAPTAQVLEHAFERAYVECWTPVFRLALAWTNDWAAAEEIAQEAFARLWARRDSIDWSLSVLPWLLTTSRRLATDRFRRLRRLMGQSRTPATTLDLDQHARWLDVRVAFDRLSPLERAALALTAVSGLASEEAATTLGTTSAAVRSAVFRARRKLEEA